MDPATPRDDSSAAARDAANFLSAQAPQVPRVALILGTGLGGLADRIAAPTIIPYADIPRFPPSRPAT